MNYEAPWLRSLDGGAWVQRLTASALKGSAPKFEYDNNINICLNVSGLAEHGALCRPQ